MRVGWPCPQDSATRRDSSACRVMVDAMNAESEPSWLALLDLQAGIVGRGQALGHGFDADTIDNRLRWRRWRTVQWGIYATFSGPLSREAALWAAVLRAGRGAALSHQTAAAGRLQAALDARPKVRWRDGLAIAIAEAGSGVHSILERRYVRDVERAHGLPAATRQAHTARIPRPRYVDNLYEGAGLVVELDGQITHGMEQHRADLRRDNAHTAAGLATLRYNWADVTQRPCGVAQQVADALTRRGAPVILRPCSPTCPVGRSQRVQAS
jgi:hypothetical protein